MTRSDFATFPGSHTVLNTRNILDHLIQRAILDAPALRGGAVQRVDGIEVDHDEPQHERFRARLLTALGRRGWVVRADAGGRGSADIVLHGPHGVALHLRLDSTDAICCAFSGSAEESEAAVREFSVLARRFAGMRREGDLVPVRVWSMGSGGPSSRLRRVKCPTWGQIEGNYPRIARRLDWLMRLQRPHEVGHVVFWHGSSGTGKTWAVRALLREWRHMQIEIVSDPATFLENPSLVNELLMDPPHRPSDQPHIRRQRPLGRLLVFEDSPELQLAEQGFALRGTMSKLLNATDGLLDGAVPTVILATTHEPLPEHETALLRPGRCLQVEHFPLLEPREALAWLANQGHPARAPQGPISLAELYAQLRGDGVQAPERRVRMGFRAS